MNKKMIGFVAFAIFIIGSGFILLKSDSVPLNSKQYKNLEVVNQNANQAGDTPVVDNSQTAPVKTPANTISPKVNSAPIVKSGYTMSDVSKHNSSSSCWTAVYGNVYDVTDWIGQHPGGSRAILSMCGTDGTGSFDDQHGGQRRANAELANYKIGALLK